MPVSRPTLSKGDRAAALIEQARRAATSFVNNAGIQHVCPIDEFPTEKDAIIAIQPDIGFPIQLLPALPLMRKASWGGGQYRLGPRPGRPSPYKSAYVAAKHGCGRPVPKQRRGDPGQGIHLQRDLAPGICAWTPLVESAYPDTNEEIQHEPRGRDREVHAGTPAFQGIRHRGNSLAEQPCSCALRTQPPRSRHTISVDCGGPRCNPRPCFLCLKNIPRGIAAAMGPGPHSLWPPVLPFSRKPAPYEYQTQSTCPAGRRRDGGSMGCDGQAAGEDDIRDIGGSPATSAGALNGAAYKSVGSNCSARGCAGKS